MRTTIVAFMLLALSAPALAGKSCDELKTGISSKLEAKHVTGFSLEVVTADPTGEGKVVGTCDGGKKKIVYSKK